MTQLPVISGKNLVRVLEKIGFVLVRQSGSHCQLRHADGRRVTVPIHSNQDLPRGTLHGILRDIKLEVDALVELLK